MHRRHFEGPQLFAADAGVVPGPGRRVPPRRVEAVLADRSKVKRLLLTSGKIYYELVARKDKDERADVAIVRVEQLAPLPKRRLNETLDSYPNAEQYFWVQEEPANQGAWPTFGLTLPEVCSDRLSGIKRISRRAMSAPSSGSSKVHAVEQQEIIDEAFAP